MIPAPVLRDAGCIIIGGSGRVYATREMEKRRGEKREHSVQKRDGGKR